MPFANRNWAARLKKHFERSLVGPDASEKTVGRRNPLRSEDRRAGVELDGHDRTRFTTSSQNGECGSRRRPPSITWAPDPQNFPARKMNKKIRAEYRTLITK
jgi:hypothetical protein